MKLYFYKTYMNVSSLLNPPGYLFGSKTNPIERVFKLGITSNILTYLNPLYRPFWIFPLEESA